MKTTITWMMMLATAFLWAVAGADTFTHKETGQSFNGFMTQKTMGSLTRVFDSSQNTMVSIDLNAYTVTPNSRGRRDVAAVIPIKESEVLLSEVIAKAIADDIIKASNLGSQVIILDLDSPGGRGDYMQIIAAAVEQTQNCPVVAYISGKAYGGAFSAAAVVALACDRIFIDPTASIGAVAPMTDTSATPADFEAYIATYASKSLILRGVDRDAERLAAAGNRPGLVARALIDQELSVIEVTNVDGSHAFILKDNRQPTQTIVRTLAEGVTPGEETGTVSAVDRVRLTLQLPAAEAVKVGLADALAGGYYDILTAMDIPDTQITTSGSIDKVIRQYQAARRNMAENLARLSTLEQQAETLQGQVDFIQDQLRTGTETREVQRGGGNDAVYQRGSTLGSPLPDDYVGYYYDPQTRMGVTTRDSARRSPRRALPLESETITTTVPTTRLSEAQRNLAAVLEDLRVEYRRAMVLAKRWPGSLPPDVGAATFERNIQSINAFLDRLYDDIDAALRQEELDAQQQDQAPGRTRTNRTGRSRQ